MTSTAEIEDKELGESDDTVSGLGSQKSRACIEDIV